MLSGIKKKRTVHRALKFDDTKNEDSYTLIIIVLN